jgi:hypothetical protein
MKLRLLGIVVAAVAFAAALDYSPSAQLGFRYEPGIETNLVLGAAIDIAAGAGITADANIGFGLIEQMGVVHYRVGAGGYPLLGHRLGFDAAVEHDQWVEWATGENRAVGMVKAKPFSSLGIGVGAAWRAPVTGDSAHPSAYSSPFNWQGEWPEWNLLYDLRWRFLSGPHLGLGAYISNHDAWSIRNPQQFPFGLDADYRTGDILFTGQLGTCINGLSGLLFSLGETRLTVGVKRAL